MRSLLFIVPFRDVFAASAYTKSKKLTMLLLAIATAIDYTPSPLRERLSSIFGSISFACWMILMLPQLVEQWRLKTVEGISPIFLIIWSLGDVLNFIGSIWAGLLPEVILIASWFLFADLFTFAFYLYIKIVYDKKRDAKHKRQIDDEALLLGEHNIHYEHEHVEPTSSTDYGAIPTTSNEHDEHHHHHHHHGRRKSTTLEDVVFEPENHSVFVKYVLPLLLVISAGTFGSILSPNSTSKGHPDQDTTLSFLVVALQKASAKEDPLGPQILGYLSAFLYLTARFPQIYHNYKKKSTKGLSLLFFLLTMLGNITYSLQIVVYRWDYDYLILNMSWLLGSLGTIFEDMLILSQFYMYRDQVVE